MLQYNYYSFFNKDNKDQFRQDLEDILVGCINTKSCLSFERNEEDFFHVMCCKIAPMDKGLYIKGSLPKKVDRLKISLLNGNILLPFLMDIEKVIIPHNYIFFYGRKDACMGDFLARNLSINLCIRSKMTVDSDSGIEWGGRSYIQLLNAYYWFLKNNFPTDVDDRTFSKELIFANCFLNVLNFKNSRLISDYLKIKSILRVCGDEFSNGNIVDKLMLCRDMVIDACYT